VSFSSKQRKTLDSRLNPRERRKLIKTGIKRVANKEIAKITNRLSHMDEMIFDHSFATLPPQFFTRVVPTPMPAPYLVASSPSPYRGKRNEPLYVIETTKKLAVLKDAPPDAFGRQVLENVRRVFGIRV
jgi:hypothetical protein